MVKNPFKNISIGAIFTFILAGLILTQVVSLLVSSIFSSVPALRTGSLLILLSAGMTMIFLAKVVFSGNFGKMDILGLLILGTITIGMYYYLPQFFPELFSFMANTTAGISAQNLASILNLP